MRWIASSSRASTAVSIGCTTRRRTSSDPPPPLRCCRDVLGSLWERRTDLADDELSSEALLTTRQRSLEHLRANGWDDLEQSAGRERSPSGADHPGDARGEEQPRPNRPPQSRPPSCRTRRQRWGDLVRTLSQHRSEPPNAERSGRNRTPEAE
jgi:hypothetical protein